MKKQLVVLAAGMGSRYGGLKQMDPIGPSGEFILDYSVYDAIRAGFSEVVFVIRRDLEADFRRIVGDRWLSAVSVKYAFQELTDIPAGFEVPAGRVKPWGTGHALLAAREIIDSPFAMVNADDFYGRDGFMQLAGFLDKPDPAGTGYAMVAYRVDKTLSENGTVSRGVCTADSDGFLKSIVEETAIARDQDGVIRANGRALADDTPVSMNLFGFKPGFIGCLSERFKEFLLARISEPKAEFFVPTVVGSLIGSGSASVKMFRSDSEWFGVTNAADRPGVVARFAGLVKNGEYPASLLA